MEDNKKAFEYDEEFENIEEEIEFESDEENESEETNAVNEDKAINIKINNGRRWPIFFLLIVVIVVIGFFGGNVYKNHKEEIKATSDLKKVIKISKLSSFKMVHNGIATKYDKDKEPLYHVRYDATVKAGIDASKIKLKVNRRKKVIDVRLPKIQILDSTVDVASQDYIFEDEDENDRDISSESYKLCLKDLGNEVTKEKELYKSARANAKKIVRGLIEPLVEQDDYKVVVK